MNELQRQMYLTALGVDTYMPRWHLPFAPASVICELPEECINVVPSPENIVAASITNHVMTESASQSSVSSVPIAEPTSINNLIGGIFESKKPAKNTSGNINAATILAQLSGKSVEVIKPFSLSVWRPAEGIMIVDSRNTKLALPTEMFLNNILRNFISEQSFKLQEEVLRWPMIENSLAKLGVNDARNELQTWLSVQHEIKPIRYLWLMGANAATYIVPEDLVFSASIFQSIQLENVSITAQVLPSLNELLQTPSLKRQLFSALNNYHSK